MFEQSLYNQEAFADVESHEGDLFHKYEIKTWDLAPRIYKILAGSAIANILVITIVGQTSLLTVKTCDSPLVGMVCQVLDTVYVGSILFGTQREYVDQAYEKTELGDADVTFVDVTSETPPLEYPEGYFALANPEQFAMQQANSDNGFIAPGIPNYGNRTPDDLLHTKAIPPKENPNSVVGPIPTSPLGGDDDTSVAINRKKRGGQKFPGVRLPNDSPNSLPKVDDQTANANTNTEPKVTPTDPVKAEDINKRPFKDLGNYVNDLRAKNEINLDTQFLVNAKGKLTKDGKLDPKSFKFVKATSSDSNQKMIEVVKEGIEAISDSGYLNYLKELSGKDLDLLVQQNDQTLSAVIQSEMEDETRARTITAGLNFLIGLKKGQKDKPDADQNDKDDLLLLSNARVEAKGKKIVITFEVPKEVVQQMIQRKLDELAKEPKQEGGPTDVKTSQNTAKNQ